MDDTTAQVVQNQSGNVQQTDGQQGTRPQNPIAPQVKQPVSGTLSKEHAPLSEHMQVSDPLEAMPEVRQELKEHGVDVKQDEARLELTREQQDIGMQHAPSATPVGKHLEEQKPEFPMTYEFATVKAKKGSVWSSLRWLATLVLKQMKMKTVADKPV